MHFRTFNYHIKSERNQKHWGYHSTSEAGISWLHSSFMLQG